MDQAIFLTAAILSLVSLILLVVKPLWGVMGIFIARPLVDATWAQTLIFDFKLTELVSSLVPLIVFMRMLFEDGSRRPFKDMPLKWIWVVYSLDSILFSSQVMFQEDWRAGLSVLMRHLDGIAGFYMVQAYCRDDHDFLRFAWAMAIGGFFPIVTGVIEGATGFHWRITMAENDVVRNIGLYHDAITIRFYALQTIMSLLLIMVLGKRSLMKTLFCVIYGLATVFVVKGAYSKSGALTLGVWILLWPILRKNYKALVGIAIASLLVSAYFSKEIMDSVGFIFVREIGAVQGKLQLDQTFAGRWHIWGDLIKEWNGLPLSAQMFGAGHTATGAHNDYLQILFHGGWFGLAIYVTLLLAMAWAILRSLFAARDIWSIAPLFVFIMWVVDTIGLVPSAYSSYQWFAWGVIGYCLRRRASERAAPHATTVDPVRSVEPRFPNLMGAV